MDIRTAPGNVLHGSEMFSRLRAPNMPLLRSSSDLDSDRYKDVAPTELCRATLRKKSSTPHKKII